MSYSFNVQAATKAAAKEAVVAKFGEVVASQPIHARDKDAATANANAVIDLLADGDDRTITVSVNGYVGWQEALRDDASNPLQSASISTSASYV